MSKSCPLFDFPLGYENELKGKMKLKFFSFKLQIEGFIGLFLFLKSATF